MTDASALVIGFGNRDRGDDAAGPLVVDRLLDMALVGLTLDACDGDATRLIDRWTGHETVVVVDAVRSGRRPGELVTLSAADLEEEGFAPPTSTHGLGLRDAVRLARAARRLPCDLWIIGIEGERFTLGAAVSPAVLGATQRAARLVAEQWGGYSCTS